MPDLVDMAGQRIGSWLVLKHVAGSYWLCRCDCGREFEVTGGKLRQGKSSQCRHCRVTKHGKSHKGDPTYESWKHMRRRVLTKSSPDYRHYGGRGITICARWTSFEAFLVDMGAKPKGLALERLDVNKGYAPDNCVWATQKQQTRNQRRCRWVTYLNRTQSLADWCDELALNYQRIHARLERGWPVEKAFKSGTYGPNWKDQEQAL